MYEQQRESRNSRKMKEYSELVAATEVSLLTCGLPLFLAASEELRFLLVLEG